MNDRPTIVLCDDVAKTRESWKAELEALPHLTESFEVAVVDEASFKFGIEELENRRTRLRHNESPTQSETIFDHAAILIVDYDLFNYDQQHLFSGDSVAYLARGFSQCGYIVGVNQDRVSNPFDATLTAHVMTYTDVSIGSEHVADPGLWCHDPAQWNDFRPWVWPLLTERAQHLPRLAEQLVDLLDTTVESVLGLERDQIATMPRSIVAPLDAPAHADLSQLTLRQWVHEGQMALRAGDKAAEDAQIARVAAARLSKWFERVLLPGQDFLVDAPHLVERRPGLLSEDSRLPDSWNAVVRLDAEPSELAITDAAIARHRFAEQWLSRPAWLWSEIGSDPELDEAGQAPKPEPALVFAEDSSCFVSREDATRFRTDLDSPFKSRWLALPDSSVTYLPAARLTTG